MSASPAPIGPRRTPIVVAKAALRPIAPVWQASAPLVAEVGLTAFVIGGIAAISLGTVAPWFVLAAVLVGAGLRRAHVESWSLFIPGGAIGRVQDAFGRRPALVAAAVALFERMLFIGLACLAASHYAVSFLLVFPQGQSFSRYAVPKDLVAPLAVVFVAVIWIRLRLGRSADPVRIAHWTWIALGALVVLSGWGAATWFLHGAPVDSLTDFSTLIQSRRPWLTRVPFGVGIAVAAFAGFGRVLPAMGTAESLQRVASDLPQPRLDGLRRVLLVVAAVALLLTAVASFLYTAIVPVPFQSRWSNIPLVGLALHLAAPGWIRIPASIIVVASALFLLASAARVGLSEAETTLKRLTDLGLLGGSPASSHPRFGNYMRVTDTAVAAIVIGLLASGGNLPWFTAAYGAGVAWTQVIKVAALIRLRRQRQPSASGRTPGLLVLGVVVLASGVALLLTGDAASWAGTGAMAGLAVLFVLNGRRPTEPAEAGAPDAFELLPSTALSIDQVKARPGGILVAVGHPNSLGHLAEAMRVAGDRDVVAMTVRLLNSAADGDECHDVRPTEAERVLFSNVVALAERYCRAVRLLIVPAHDSLRCRGDHRDPSQVVGDLRRRISEPFGRYPGAAARRSLGARGQAGAHQRPPRDPAQQWPLGSVLSWRPRTDTHPSRHRPHSPAMARHR